MKKLSFREPYPKQRTFLLSRARYTAYGGARGGGKSHVARMKAELLCLRYDGIQVLFMRRTYPELKENHLLPAMKELNGIASYKGVDKAFLFPNGARLKFGYCRNDAELLQYQGQAYDVIFLEECTQFPENVFTTMTESNRSSGLMKEPFPPRMYFTCNPGGVGHAWFKRLFIDKDYKETERASDYVFIQATARDNPWLLENSPDYIRALENLPEDRKRAMLYGDWDVFEGQYFPEFRRDTHTCEAFPIPDSWKKYRVFDYGFDMFAAYFVAMDTEGRAYFYKEIYEGEQKELKDGNHGTGLTIYEAARKLSDISTEEEKRSLTFAPPDMWNRRQESGRSAQEIFASYGVPLYKTSNSRVQGWMDVKDWLRVREDGKPRIIVFRNCVNLIRTMPLVLHDEKNPDDVAKEPHEATHAPDAVRYFVAGQPLAARDPDIHDEDYQSFEEDVNNVFDYY